MEESSSSQSEIHTQTQAHTPIVTATLLETPSKFWYINHRYMLSPRFLVPWFIGLLVVYIGVGMLVIVLAPDGTTVYLGCLVKPAWTVCLRSFQFMFIIIMIFQAYKMREVVEGFYIKREMLQTAITAAVIIVSWTLYGAIDSLIRINTKYFPLSSLSGYLLVVLFFTYSVIVPLYYSVSPQPKLNSFGQDIPRNFATLNDLLKHSMGVKAFKQFLSREFSVENLLFIEVVSDYQLRTEQMRNNSFPGWRDEQTRIAKFVYNRYVRQDAPNQVNLPGHILNRIQMVLDTSKMHASIPAKRRSLILHDSESMNLDTVFDEARRNVFALMESDSFRRFLISDICQTMLAEARKKAREHVILKDMKII